MTDPVGCGARGRTFPQTFVLPIALRLLVLAIGVLRGGVPAYAQIIAPGQEELLAGMLGKGAQLPGGCALTGGAVDYDVVHATYRCPYGDVAIDLSHPGARSAPAMVIRGRLERSEGVINVVADHLAPLTMAAETRSRDFR